MKIKQSISKTILVIYTNDLIKDKKEIQQKKKYSFNTTSLVKLNDLINSSSYDTNIQVVKVLNKAYKYFNSMTGELSDDFNSTLQWEIRDLIIRDEPSDVIFGKII